MKFIALLEIHRAYILDPIDVLAFSNDATKIFAGYLKKIIFGPKTAPLGSNITYQATKWVFNQVLTISKVTSGCLHSKFTLGLKGKLTELKTGKRGKNSSSSLRSRKWGKLFHTKIGKKTIFLAHLRACLVPHPNAHKCETRKRDRLRPG